MKYLTIEKFGKRLLETLDLDPIYVMLFRAREKQLITHSELCSWCMTYWCCYHAGVSSYVTESCQYPKMLWKYLSDVSQNHSRIWPRGAERRHFRGNNGLVLIQNLKNRYHRAESFINYVTEKSLLYSQVSSRIQEHTGFGPWISFKICDMLERVFQIPISFQDAVLYTEPRKGAILACSEWKVPFDLSYTVTRLSNVFEHEYAPPTKDRVLNIQEIETILCKWKAHMNGNYPIGKDIKEISHAMKGFGSLSDSLSKELPDIVHEGTLI